MVLEELEFVPVPPTETRTLSAGTNGMRCHNQHQLSSTRFSPFRALRMDFKLLVYILSRSNATCSYQEQSCAMCAVDARLDFGLSIIYIYKTENMGFSNERGLVNSIMINVYFTL